MTVHAGTFIPPSQAARHVLARFGVFTAICLLYFAVLSYVHINYISTYFAYEGFERRIDLINAAMSVFIIMFFAYYCVSIKSFSANIFSIYIFQFLISSLVLFSFGNRSDEFIIASLLGFGIVFVASPLFKIPNFRIRRIPSQHIMLAIFVMAVLYFLLLIMFGGLQFLNFSFSEVYQYRRDAGDNLPGIFQYISPIMGKVLIPAMAVIALIRKSWAFFALSLFFSFMIFAFTSHKAPAVFSIAAAIIYLIYNRTKYFYMVMGIIIISMAILSMLLFMYSEFARSFQHLYFGALLGKRMFLTPVQLNSYYIEFFAENPKLLWESSKFTFGLLERDYSLGAANIIGDIFFYDENTSANTGWVGSGFSHAGLAGVVFYSVLIVVLVAFLASAGRRVGDGFVISVSLPTMATILMSADFTTVIVTHGLWVLVLLFLFIEDPRPRTPGDGAPAQAARI